MGDEERVAALARVLAHETCVRLMDALGAGEATVSDLVCRVGLEQPRVSTHLALLREAGLVDCRADGRQRVYALRGEAPALALTTLRSLAASLAGGSPAGPDSPPGQRLADDAPVRLARTCYDHLAGVAGVRLLDDLLDRGWLVPDAGRDLRLSDAGADGLTAAGVDLAAARRSRRAFAIQCADWTERRSHLGGALGAALLAALLGQGRARLRPGGRVVDVQPAEPAGLLAGANAREGTRG
jgi:DNA-binding transcriptional ArsR family regulator